MIDDPRRRINHPSVHTNHCHDAGDELGFIGQMQDVVSSVKRKLSGAAFQRTALFK